MRRLSAFEQISIDGYFSTLDGSISWMHRPNEDAEFREFVTANASGGAELLFGRTTYELMAAYWPTPAAAAQSPVVAREMTARPKWVVSRTLRDPGWQHVRVLTGDLRVEVASLKAAPGPPITILGSGSLVAQLTDARLIDEYQMLILPTALGAGRPLTEGLSRPLDLRLVR